MTQTDKSRTVAKAIELRGDETRRGDLAAATLMLSAAVLLLLSAA